MQINNFIRFSESIKTREDMRVVSVTIRPLIAECTGDIYFTDLQLQEGSRLTGYTPHTTTMLKNSKNPPKYFNAVVRSGDTLVLHTSGGTSTGLDCYIYPNQAMAAGSVKLSQGAGSHQVTFLSSASVLVMSLLYLHQNVDALKTAVPHRKTDFTNTQPFTMISTKFSLKKENQQGCTLNLKK